MSSDHALGEFDIIRQYFSSLTDSREDVITGIGDDCALLSPPAGKLLAVSTDTLVSGRHFYADVDPVSLGHKALAVNLSDLSAMGAEPAWASLALTLPEVDQSWLKKFSQGFATLARQYDLQLIGGDTTQGPLAITITVHGLVDADKVIKRSGAQPGDLLFISGCIGEAARGLQLLNNKLQVEETAWHALHYPQPRVLLGKSLAGIASAAIDISDGLLADAGHICESSACGAIVEINKLPVCECLKGLPSENRLSLQLAGGDDYELCFTVPPEKVKQLAAISEKTGVQLTQIGVLDNSDNIKVVDAEGNQLQYDATGYQHFHEKTSKT